VALRGGEVIARAAWWAFPSSPRPLTLDWFEPGTGPDRVEVGARLLRAAYASFGTDDGERPAYHLFLPPGWRDIPAARDAADARVAAAEKAGLTPFVERLRFSWTRDDDAPPRSDRLVFRPAGDEEILDAVRRSLHGTLDAISRQDAARQGRDFAASAIVDELGEFPSPRDWWRLAYTPGGELVGVTIPARNYTAAVIGYIAVVPEQRGHGYADDLLAEATRLLMEHGADLINADTDLGNTPMAASFRRCGYRNTGIRLVLQ
jgi:ribosomal protein S18 acetylase RimI-like enzyme